MSFSSATSHQDDELLIPQGRGQGQIPFKVYLADNFTAKKKSGFRRLSFFSDRIPLAGAYSNLFSVASSCAFRRYQPVPYPGAP